MEYDDDVATLHARSAQQSSRVTRPPEVRKAHREAQARRKAQRQQRKYAALADETRATVDTDTAAHHLGRQPQTLRIWASNQSGPLQPLHINGRLAWSVPELRKLNGVAK